MSRQHVVAGHGGTRLAVFDHGPEDAPPILMVHGWSQHHLSWDRQLDLARDHRLVLPDLRGHGASDKPLAADAYDRSEPWAGDIAAIIDQLRLDRPVLVGWSMGGAVSLDYLRVTGGQGIAGLVLVGAGVTTGVRAPEDARAARAKDAAVVAEGMYSADQRANLDATLTFLNACFHQPPAREDLAVMMGFNMLVPPQVRAAARLRHEDYRPAASGFAKPALIIAGTGERMALPSMIAEAASTFPDAQVLHYEGCGHSPFWENPERFNRDIARFVAAARAQSGHSDKTARHYA